MIRFDSRVRPLLFLAAGRSTFHLFPHFAVSVASVAPAAVQQCTPRLWSSSDDGRWILLAPLALMPRGLGVDAAHRWRFYHDYEEAKKGLHSHPSRSAARTFPRTRTSWTCAISWTDGTFFHQKKLTVEQRFQLLIKYLLTSAWWRKRLLNACFHVFFINNTQRLTWTYR